MRVRRTVRRVEYRCSGLRSRCFLLSFLFATPLFILYHSGLLFKDDGTLIAEKVVKENLIVAKHGRPAVGDDVMKAPDFEDFNTNLLVYNRVPKCGSIWMTRLMYLLGAGDRNSYNVESPYEPGEKPFLTQSEEQVVVNHLESVPHPSLYIRHQYFIDFHEHGKKRPLYINVIRDPVEKFRSFYYFIRNGNKEGDGGDVPMSEIKRLTSIDECVKMQDKECTQPKWQLVPYFCGQDPRCRQRNSWAVEKAKNNIENYYAAIGLVEDLESSLKIFERLLPRYFKGAIEIKHEGEKKIQNDTYTLNKQSMSPETIEFFKTKTSISLEYDLYNYVAARFEQLKLKFGIS